VALQTTEPILTAKAINHYYDHAYDFVYDQIVFPARRSIPHLEITSQQKGFLDEISKYPRVAIESGHGCHTKGTRILMRDGREKNVEDVEVGDQLLGSSGNCRDYRTVLRLKRGRQRCYKIEYRDGTGYEVNASHELCLVATQSHGRQVSGEKIQVKVDDYLDWSDRKKRTNAGYKTIGVFRKKHLCVPPYIMGLWLGDGSAGKPSITSVDKEVISKWDSYAKSLRLKLRRQKDEYFITSGLLKKGMKQHRNGFVSELKRYGVFSEKRIPFNYKTSTMKDRLELIAGLVDTDGCIDHGGYSITQKSKKLAEDILWVVRSLGFIAYIRKVRKKCHNSPTGKVGTYYTISFSGLCDLVPCRIERKRVAKSRKKRRNLHYMIKVTPIGVRNYYGFTLDGDNLYVLNDFSVLKNTGKSASLSWAGIWFITTRFNTLGYPVKIPSIAPTYHQLMDILWPEFRRWIALSRLRLVMKVQHEEIFFDKYKTEAFICARSPKKPENVQGFHAAHLFWLCDEAFGILDDLVWETIEGSMTEEDNRIVIAGQHTMISGYCHEAFTRDKERWRRLRFSSEDSPLAKTEYSDRIAEKYGRDSDIYRVRVSGMAPKGNPESFIQLERVLRATKREASRFGKATMGVDVARFGDDSTVVTMLAGNVVFKQEVRSKTNTDDICSLILHVLYEYREWAKDKNLVEVNVDNTGGYGAGVIDTLSKDRSNNIRVNPVNFTGKIKDPEYHDGVSKMWGELRDKIDDLQLPDDDFLVEELSTRTFKIVDGKVKIQPKSDFKTIYKSSPDRSDSLVLALTKKAAARRVWEGLLANDLKKDFVVDFHNLSNSYAGMLTMGRAGYENVCADRNVERKSGTALCDGRRAVRHTGPRSSGTKFESYGAVREPGRGKEFVEVRVVWE